MPKGYGRIDVAKAVGESQNLFNTKDERNMTGRAEPKEMLRSMVEGATVIIPTPSLSLIHQNESLRLRGTQSARDRSKLQARKRRVKKRIKSQGPGNSLKAEQIKNMKLSRLKM